MSNESTFGTIRTAEDDGEEEVTSRLRSTSDTTGYSTKNRSYKQKNAMFEYLVKCVLERQRNDSTR
jgi:hypothetical protein